MKSKELKLIISIPSYSITFQAMDENDRIPMGYISLKFDKDKKAHLMALIRHPEFKGLGICRHLIEEALRFANAYRIEEVDCGVYKTRVGIIRLLKELGFEEIESDSVNHTKLLLKMYKYGINDIIKGHEKTLDALARK